MYYGLEGDGLIMGTPLYVFSMFVVVLDLLGGRGWEGGGVDTSPGRCNSLFLVVLEHKVFYRGEGGELPAVVS